MKGKAREHNNRIEGAKNDKGNWNATRECRKYDWQRPNSKAIKCNVGGHSMSRNQKGTTDCLEANETALCCLLSVLLTCLSANICYLSICLTYGSGLSGPILRPIVWLPSCPATKGYQMLASQANCLPSWVHHGNLFHGKVLPSKETRFLLQHTI